MKTTKPKYTCIDATVAGIPAEEPVFLLRAQDQHAVATLRHYADRVQAARGDANVVAAVRQAITEFAAWPAKKAPDLYAYEAKPSEDAVKVGGVVRQPDGSEEIFVAVEETSATVEDAPAARRSRRSA